LARDEERQATTQESMFNFVRLSDGGASAPGGELKSEVEIVCAMASRLLAPGPFPFERMTSHETIRNAIASVVPGYEKIGALDTTKQEFQISGRTYHEPRFNTPTGKLRAQTVPTETFRVETDELRLMTLRSEGQFNTVVYEEEDLYRGNRRRDVIMINAADAARRGLNEHDAVTVESSCGRMRVAVALVDIPPGNAAMYFPEANLLVPRSVDPASGTPAFKSVAVRIAK
jgi:anaerobic selenocysteine-containing dehydrogenase